MEHKGKLSFRGKPGKSMRRTLLNDIVFKLVFGSPKNERILRSLINAILGLSGEDKIVQLALMNGELSKAYLVSKGAVLDVRARDGTGRSYNIEVQVREQPHYVQRSLYYLCKLYSDQLERGEDYEKLRRTVAISILDFPLFPELAELHTRFRFCDPEQDLELSDILEIHYLELTKFRRDQPLETPLEKWLHFLKFAEIYERELEELPDSIQREEEIVMALEEMKTVYATDEVRDWIEDRLKAERDERWRAKNALNRIRAEVEAQSRAEGEARGRAEGEARGRAEGEARGRAEGEAKGRAEGEAQGRAEGEALAKQGVARALAEQGVDAETIFKATGVRLETGNSAD